MKLHFSPTSPYVRKVSVTAHELGIWQQLQCLPTDAWNTATELSRSNPLNKVPTLVLDDGSVLYDSPVICEYLDAAYGGGLFSAPPVRWPVLRGQALADGLLDAAVAVFLENRRRGENERSVWWEELQRLTIDRALDALNGDAAGFGTRLDIAQIAAGCALGYLGFRFADIDWRAGRPALANWYEGFAARDSMRLSEPRDPV